MNFRIIFKILALSLIIALLFSTIILGSACKKKTGTGIAEENGTQESSISDNGSTKETDSGSAGETSSQSVSVTETTAEIIPQEITDLITKADAYYASGEYALASKTYRNAEQAIKNSDLSEEARQLQLNLFANKYKKAKEITDTARMHFANAKTLEYQQRFEEAKKELEAALAIYPKYQEAIDEYETLKAMMGLE